MIRKEKSSVVFILLVLICLFTAAVSVFAESPVNIYFFHGKTCPHCLEEEEYFKVLFQEYPKDKIKLQEYEVWYNEKNADLMATFSKAFGFEPSGVPLTFIGDSYMVGFGEETKTWLKENIDKQLSYEKPADTMEIVNAGAADGSDGTAAIKEIDLPFIGKVSLEGKNALLVTIIIGLADGFNPCSLWVLTMLLSIVVHTDSRKKSFIIGIVYITVTAGIYALFILGVFSLLDYVRYMTWISTIVACITLVLGIINIKDYFFYKKGVSLTINDSKKPGLYKKMRGIVKNSNSLPSMIAATVVLAAGVSLIEFSCTAAFPVIWSNILTGMGITGAKMWPYLLLYMLLYQIDEIAIFAAAVITMKSKKIEEKHGRVLKLFSGLLMIALSLCMIFKRELMNNFTFVILLFAGTALFTVFFHFAYTRIKKNS